MEYSIGGIALRHPVLPAAGTCKTLAEAYAIAESDAPMITLGSYTVMPRPGNPGKTFHDSGRGTFNAMGLPNPGISFLRDELGSVCADFRACRRGCDATQSLSSSAEDR